MAVYTAVGRAELQRFLAAYPLGELVDYQGIEAGVENTNYRLVTERGRYILTLYESLSISQLPFHLALMGRLADAGLPVPRPLHDHHGRALGELHGRPAAVVEQLSGHSVAEPNRHQCVAIGDALARLHLAAVGISPLPANTRGLGWWREIAPELAAALEPEERQLLTAELAFQSRYQLLDLPRGLVHADLFHDNALFEGDRLCAILDLYAACEASWLYDLAIVVIDWATRAGPLPEPELSHAILGAYHRVRPLTPLEQGAWPVVLRQAALRFWLSRLLEQQRPRAGALVSPKDPHIFARRLAEFVKNEAKLRHLWPRL